MPGVEALRICDLPSVYDKGAPARSEATPCMPTNSGSTRPLQAWKYHKQLRDRQGETIQHVNIQMHCIPDYPDAIRKHGTTDSYSTQTVCRVSLITETRIDYYRASLHTTYPSCGISYPTGTADSLDRSRTRKAVHGSTPNCSGA